MRTTLAARETSTALKWAVMSSPSLTCLSVVSGMRARSSMTDWSWTTRTVVGGIIVTVSPTLLSLRATTPSIGEVTAESLV